MPEWTVRNASDTDLETLVAFNQQMALDTEGKALQPDVLRQGVGRALRDSTLARYLVVEDQGDVVGQLMLTEEWSDWRCGRFLWIQSVFVRPSHRRRGVYRALHAHVRRMADHDDVCGIRLYVEVENAVAQGTYRELGMDECAYRMFEQSTD